DPQVAIGHRVVVKTGAYGAGHVLEAFQSVESAGRLGRVTLHFRKIAAQAFGRPGERSAGSHRGDEVGNRAVGLFNNLRAGAVEVRLPVGRIVVLIGIEVTVGIFAIDLAAH